MFECCVFNFWLELFPDVPCALAISPMMEEMSLVMLWTEFFLDSSWGVAGFWLSWIEDDFR